MTLTIEMQSPYTNRAGEIFDLFSRVDVRDTTPFRTGLEVDALHMAQ